MRVPPAFPARDYACGTQLLSAAMFAKRTKQSSRRPPPTDDGSQTERSGSESRGDAIERLENELEEQRAATVLLQQELDATTFKTETLEKSYAKQLAEVREKLASVQAELKEKEEILSGLGGPHEHTLRELSDALAVIKVLKKQLDQLRKQNTQASSFRHAQQGTTKARALLGEDARGLMPTERNDNRGGTVSSPDDDTSDGTINSLIKDADWAERKPSVGRGQATAAVEKPPEATHAEMLSPDLVFTEKDKEKDNER
jgi:chromosome segregation ATPase